MQNSAYSEQLAIDIGGFAYDPLGFVLYAFPWGEGELAEADGPEDWQREELEAISQALKEGATASDAAAKAIQHAIASGHGIGKSALVSWIILWAMSTCVDTRGVVTANTETQLKQKTWAELAKWHRYCLCGHWFDCTATALISKQPGHQKTWRCDMVPWSERNAEAFAGLHNKGKRVFVVFDEASAIADIIWETTEGALTDDDTEILWFAFGNPTRNAGRFRECFGKCRHRWTTRKVDSRSVSLTNKAQIQQWIDDYGEDSDFVKVRVRGEFPSASLNQLIPVDLVEAAMERKYSAHVIKHSPIILGVDVALDGGDRASIVLRQGLYARVLQVVQNVRNMQLVTLIAQHIHEQKPDAVFVDKTGNGTGVVHDIQDLGFRCVHGVNFGESALDKTRFMRRREEMWWLLREWLIKENPSIEYSADLKDDLIGPEYQLTPSNKIQLESKSDMRKRGLASPDLGDALALTFAAPVVSMAALELQDRLDSVYGHDAPAVYNPFSSGGSYNPFRGGR